MARRAATLDETPTPVPGADVADRLRTAVGRLGRYLRLTHVDSDLTPSQREVLSAIARGGALRLSELAAGEGINPTMLSRIVAKLEAAGLATRTPDATDARVVHVAPTSQGRALHDEMRHERTDALRHALAGLTPAERRALEDAMPALEAVVGALKERGR
jgi:DNA-binding MarR family transcriptional regulator